GSDSSQRKANERGQEKKEAQEEPCKGREGPLDENRLCHGSGDQELSFSADHTGVVSYGDWTAGNANHSSHFHTWSVSFAAIAGERGCQPPCSFLTRRVRTAQQKL